MGNSNETGVVTATPEANPVQEQRVILANWNPNQQVLINFTWKAFREYMAYVQQGRFYRSELSGFGQVDPFLMNSKGERQEFKRLKTSVIPEGWFLCFTIDEIYFLSDGNNSGAETTIKSERAMKFFSERTAAGKSFDSVKLWWHWHPLGNGWSGTDENNCRNTPLCQRPEDVKWSISVVHTEVAGVIGRYDQYATKSFPSLSFAARIAVEWDFTPIEATVYEQLKPFLVKPVTSYVSSTPSSVPWVYTGHDWEQADLWEDEVQAYDVVGTCECNGDLYIHEARNKDRLVRCTLCDKKPYVFDKEKINKSICPACGEKMTTLSIGRYEDCSKRCLKCGNEYFLELKEDTKLTQKPLPPKKNEIAYNYEELGEQFNMISEVLLDTANAVETIESCKQLITGKKFDSIFYRMFAAMATSPAWPEECHRDFEIIAGLLK